MLYDEIIAQKLTAYLLNINAIKINPVLPFTWASGWKSPIYCDNRLTLSFPEVRTFVKNNLVTCIQQKYPTVDCIAGVATAGIPHGVLVADVLEKPFIYVRNEAKKHGLANKIEGKINAGDKVVVVEDLISTGMSSLQAVESVRNAGGTVLGLTALFTYGFEVAQTAFDAAACSFTTLTDYTSLIKYALSQNIITADMEDILINWRINPSAWGQ
ncbi:MAG: orotate phosphoribosyltransferase [Chitinophagales bacterium]|nr:orotate phosphoribosyltransferase [Chitinophagales bacterium]